ncbi:endo-1,4-beta-xylanase [Methylocystis sp. JAN1]|uniref:endo-1,4-beta-xylanase n=1 Tax=Methylocystis sp. JAN1 TaxID=3397211 RepID=UPI003FA1F91C
MMSGENCKRRDFSRRDLCKGLIGGLAFAPSRAFAEKMCRDATPATPYAQIGKIPLGEIDPYILWGAHIEGETIYDQAFLEALGREKPRVIAIGSSLKYGSLHPLSLACEREADGKKYSTWTEVDDIVNVARRFDAKVRGDALIWNDWLPDWIRQLAKGRRKNWRAQLQEAFERHFADVFSHFDAFDREKDGPIMPWCGLVNEPIEPWSLGSGGSPWRTGPWLSAFDAMPDGTPGYIHKAFEFGEKYGGPTRTEFYLNEANCESDRFGRAMRPALLKLLEGLMRAGRKIDAVGLEAHLMPQWMDDPRKPDWKPFKQFLGDIGALGLKVYITELDVNDCMIEDIAERDKLVADYTYGFVSTALSCNAVKMVTNWDFSDNYSWYRGDSSSEATFPTLGRWANCGPRWACPRPTIYDQNLLPKASRDALARAFARER